jgi:hypothetical protein
MDRGHTLDLGRRSEANRLDGRIAEWLRRSRRRREADALLRASDGRWEDHPSVAWRVAELTTPRERSAVAGTLREIAREVRDPRPGFSASVVARRGLGGHVGELEVLADRIADLDRPATGAGMLLVRDLITDGGSPLYICGDVADRTPALDRIHEALEAR